MEINVLYQFNEKYAPYAGVSITSLFENNKHVESIVVHILDDRISPISKARLIKTADDYGRKIKFIDTRSLISTMERLKIPKYRGSYSTNMKLFLPMVMTGDMDRLLYIDSDTVICGSLEELFIMDMQGKSVAMSLDSLGKKHKELIGLNKEDNYYNAGVILFDMKAWKNNMCTEQIIDHVKMVRAHYMSPDQDLLNVVLKDDICTIGIQYNYQPVHIVYGNWAYNIFFGQKGYYKNEEVTEARKAPVILHFFRFLGEFPWNKESKHPDTEIFDEYLAMSRWNDYDKQPSEQNGLVFRIERWLYKYMPSFVFLTLFKVNYEIFIKRCERDSRRMLDSAQM